MSGRSAARYPSTASTARAVSPARDLVGAHQVQVDVGPDAEDFEDLVEHLAMLRRDADARRQQGVLPHGQDQGAELDGFGPRAEYERDAFHVIGRGHR